MDLLYGGATSPYIIRLHTHPRARSTAGSVGTSTISSSLSYQPADLREPVLDISIGDALRAAVARWSTRLALVEGNLETGARRRWMFAELLADAEKVARALLQRFAPGEHVASPKDLL